VKSYRNPCQTIRRVGYSEMTDHRFGDLKANRHLKRRTIRQNIPAPEFVPPMKATPVTALPEGPEWIYEVKWDGYRALAAKHGEDVQLLSLKNKNLAWDFPAVVTAVRTIKAHTALLDGEIVAVNAEGQPSFQALQNRASLGRDWHLVYYAFDLLTLEGENLRQLPLAERKSKLKTLAETRYGLRSRKNCAPFVAGRVTDLLRPSSVMLAELVTQPAGAVSMPACSNVKPAVSTDGQETVTSAPERSTESAGRVGRYARATYADTFPPAVVNSPPAYRMLPDSASA
jgi:hypothetical protein